MHPFYISGGCYIALSMPTSEFWARTVQMTADISSIFRSKMQPFFPLIRRNIYIIINQKKTELFQMLNMRDESLWYCYLPKLPLVSYYCSCFLLVILYCSITDCFLSAVLYASFVWNGNFNLVPNSLYEKHSCPFSSPVLIVFQLAVMW